MTEAIRPIVEQIEPFDDIESEHIKDVLAWIDSGAELCRISKPDNPPKHLVSYFLLFDESHQSVMLIDHIKSVLCLPSGGHVEPGENPRTTVVREADEELQIVANFETPFGDNPLFVTVTRTVGHGRHTDVSLWYVIAGNRDEQLNYDKGEINGYSWLELDDVLATDIRELDPCMHRFVGKMQGVLAGVGVGNPKNPDIV